MNQFRNTNMGWICPKCGKVYASYIPSCTKCTQVEKPAPRPKLPEYNDHNYYFKDRFVVEYHINLTSRE